MIMPKMKSKDWKYLMTIALLVAALQWFLFILNLSFGYFSWVIFPQAVLWSIWGIYSWSQMNKIKENKHISNLFCLNKNKKITNKENEIGESDLFYRNLNEFKEYGKEIYLNNEPEKINNGR